MRMKKKALLGILLLFLVFISGCIGNGGTGTSTSSVSTTPTTSTVSGTSTSTTPTPSPTQVPERIELDGRTWKLVWHDEFDGNEVNKNYWTFEKGNGIAYGIPGWGNGELQYYTENNTYIENGILVIEARKEIFTDPNEGTFLYTSSRLKTDGKVEFTPPIVVEARMKLPKGKGLWPAFWMLGKDIREVGWPKCGEIDIMEFLGHELRTVHGTVHGPGYSGSKGITKAYTLPAGVPDFTEDFHVFTIVWYPDGIKWYVDGELYHEVTREQIEAMGNEWVFDKPFYVILNLAVGGYWPGRPDATTPFPARMYVDYVSVYSLEG
jgi:beta-glucanase (GH16 family)